MALYSSLRYERSNAMPKVGHIWLFADLILLEGFSKFFKLKIGDRL
jgi:hypothetical protein